MRIMFIIPTPGYGLIDREKKIKKKVAGFYIPLGIASLATVLEKYGHTCKVLDLQVEQFTEQGLAREIRKFKSEVVCIAVLTALTTEAYKIAELVKQEIGIPVIAGGHHVSQLAEQILNDDNPLDYILYGEAEYKLLNLVNALEKGSDPAKVRGIFFRRGGRVVATPPAPVIENLDELPVSLRRFFDMKKYIPSSNQYKRLPLTNMITSRGCNYALCTFCAQSGKLHIRYRRISVPRAIEEVKYLIDQYKIREIYFWDDVFVFPKKWVEDFCNELKQEKIDLSWSCYAKVNYVNLDILKRMASAGCWSIFYGLESGSQELLDNIRKGQTIAQMRRAIQWTQDAGIETRGSFMLGLPGETPELGRKTIDFAIELGVDYANFCLTTPFPGSKLYDEFIQDVDASNIDFSKFTVFVPTYVPKGYDSAEQLRKMEDLAYRKFYMRPGYFVQRFKSIKNKDDLLRHLRAASYFFKTRFINIGL